MLDENNTGFFDFAKYLSAIGENWNDEEIAEEKANFDAMDLNKDGKVDREEFRKYLFESMKKSRSIKWVTWRFERSPFRNADLANLPFCWGQQPKVS